MDNTVVQAAIWIAAGGLMFPLPQTAPGSQAPALNSQTLPRTRQKGEANGNGTTGVDLARRRHYAGDAAFAAPQAPGCALIRGPRLA